MATVDKICRLLDDLPASNEPLSVLEELKLLIFATAPSNLKDIVPNVSFAGVFDCLNTDDG